MKVSSRWMFLPALGCALFAAACATDVPYPEDPSAQTWGPELKAANKNWQPPKEMPEGNPEYLTALKNGAEPAKTAENASVKATEEPTIDVMDLKEMGLEPASAQIKDTVLINISADQKFKFNDAAAEEQDLKLFLKDFSTANKGAKAEITYDATQSEKAGEIALFCKKNGFASVTLKCIGAPAAKAKAAGKVPAYEIDRTAPVKTYTVVKGDSLSKIAQKEYKNGNYWFVLYQENKDVLKSANALKPGMKLKVPALISKTAKNVK